MLSIFGKDKFLETYATAIVYINKSILAEEASVSISRSTSAKPIVTVHGGYVGDSPGTGTCEVVVTSNIPSTDFEFDPGQFMYGSRKVEFDFFVGTRVLSFRGQIYSDNFQHAVNSKADISFNARGRFFPSESWWGRA